MQAPAEAVDKLRLPSKTAMNMDWDHMITIGGIL